MVEELRRCAPGDGVRHQAAPVGALVWRGKWSVPQSLSDELIGGGKRHLSGIALTLEGS